MTRCARCTARPASGPLTNGAERATARRRERATVDTLVIGAGAAGLRAAIAAAAHGRVLVVARAVPRGGSTFRAQGGVALPIGADDSIDAHVADTLIAGAGLSGADAARSIVARGGDAMECLLRWGMRVDRDALGRIALGLEGGHSRRRVLHADGDAIGREIIRVLLARAREDPNITIVGGVEAIDLLVDESAPAHARRVGGAWLGGLRAGVCAVRASATILASGGAAAVFRETTNGEGAIGAGIAMAHRAGARVRDMEFVQFHPTALCLPRVRRTLISEAVRGEGAFLVDRAGSRFMLGVHPLAELAPRDVVSLAIRRVQSRCGPHSVFLDARRVSRFAARFPGIFATLERHGIDPSRQPIPVTPAAHYLVGGVATDLEGRTSLPGLYAAGETASTGMHGANRLASNSLLEALVMGEAAGRATEEQHPTIARAGADTPNERGPCRRERRNSERTICGEAWSTRTRAIRSLMWQHVGIERSALGLEYACARVDAWRHEVGDETPGSVGGRCARNMLEVASLIARAALERRQSCGCHYRTDAPAANAPTMDPVEQGTLAPSDVYSKSAARRPPTGIVLSGSSG